MIFLIVYYLIPAYAFKTRIKHNIEHKYIKIILKLILLCFIILWLIYVHSVFKKHKVNLNNILYYYFCKHEIADEDNILKKKIKEKYH
jgi:cbb3-type cytochrome oxidase subunit 3